MVQRLDLSGTRKPQRGRNIGPVGGLLLLPVLLVGGLLSIPISLLVSRSDRRKERRFAERMRGAGRTISLEALAENIRTCNGAIVREWRRMYKGPVRLWWTPVDHYLGCPYPSVDVMTMWHEKEGYRVLLEWCWLHYTNPQTGKAFFVEGPLLREAIPGIDGLGNMRFLDIPMAHEHRYVD